MIVLWIVCIISLVDLCRSIWSLFIRRRGGNCLSPPMRLENAKEFVT